MMFTSWQTLNWSVLFPQIIILITAILVLLTEITLPKEASRKPIFLLGMVGIVAAFISLVVLAGTTDTVLEFGNALRLDGFALLFSLILMVGTFLVFLLGLDGLDEARPTGYESEYVALSLFALLGGLVLAEATDLITLFIGLELLSISAYVLVGVKKQSLLATEGALKYVLTGGIASAVFLFGASYLVGLSGVTNLYEIALVLAQGTVMDRYGPLVFIGFLFMLTGLSFKIASVPFYMWVPDVYQGAPLATTTFLATVSKTAGFAFLIRLLLATFYLLPVGGQEFMQQATPYVAALSIASMLIGNLLAMRQVNLKRMLAYSSIAHAGYILIPLASFNPNMVDEMAFYLVAYLFMTFGAFAVIDAAYRDSGSYDLKALAGLYHRAPFLAIAILVFMLSLAGLPITAGFWAKWYIFIGAIWGGHMVLAITLAVASIISYYYYFAVLKQVFMRPGTTERPLKQATGSFIVTVVAFAGTLLIGLFPQSILDMFQHVFHAANMFDLFQGRF
ncbi:MAG: NADH-ubiquinone oxidoreductase chain N [Candidatus Carbobacillus altaicus]|uniref:NADH-quinone oxidoreductase subunit N n=1 Tax=Candidatus Carbonibacillus altaicus TaxID=2163959 RepID=A0A2R6XXX0_9BACL|nr:MAG: NADH-ubiquinone oxidoreductase chain N [Candidatus Carbobacillus altaicus]